MLFLLKEDHWKCVSVYLNTDSTFISSSKNQVKKNVVIILWDHFWHIAGLGIIPICQPVLKGVYTQYIIYTCCNNRNIVTTSQNLLWFPGCAQTRGWCSGLSTLQFLWEESLPLTRLQTAFSLQRMRARGNLSSSPPAPRPPMGMCRTCQLRESWIRPHLRFGFWSRCRTLRASQV